MMYWLGYLLFLCLGGGGLIFLLVRLHRSKTYPFLGNLTLVILALFVTFMALEFYFKVFYTETDTIYTLAFRNWHERYYEGTFNSLGYRDKEWTPEMIAGKTKVMVVGDSFVEGVGIEYTQDRFPDRLAQKLGPNYAVFNVGRGGAETDNEIQAIIKYPYSPDILVLAYFINDIGDKSGEFGVPPLPKEQVSPLLSPLVQNSYALNFFYWRLIHILQAGQPDAKWEWLLKLYNHPGAWWVHQQDLLSIVKGAKSQHIPLLVVVFPSMTQIEESKVVTERIIRLFDEQGVPTLDVTPLIKDLPTKELIASPVDPHPSERVHQLVAEALYNMFIEQKLVK
jgi:hypothetical protein